MNDRFKFRVWNIKYGLYCDQLTEMVINNNGVCYDNGVNVDYFEYNGFVVEQCTGLKDKNGNLIYEGDIVEDMWGDVLFIKWRDSEARFAAEDDNVAYDLEDVVDGCEIIGNIHEQPEQKDK